MSIAIRSASVSIPPVASTRSLPSSRTASTCHSASDRSLTEPQTSTIPLAASPSEGEKSSISGKVTSRKMLRLCSSRLPALSSRDTVSKCPPSVRDAISRVSLQADLIGRVAASPSSTRYSTRRTPLLLSARPSQESAVSIPFVQLSGVRVRLSKVGAWVSRRTLSLQASPTFPAKSTARRLSKCSPSEREDNSIGNPTYSFSAMPVEI